MNRNLLWFFSIFNVIFLANGQFSSRLDTSSNNGLGRLIRQDGLYTESSPMNGEEDDSSSQGEEVVCQTAACVQAAGSILAAMNMSADPCDDFYEFACGGFALRQSIPGGESKLYQSTIIEHIVNNQLRSLLEIDADVDGNESLSRQKTRRYYKSCMDVDAVKTNGVLRMREMVAKLGGLYLLAYNRTPSSWTLTKALIAFNAYSKNAFFETDIFPDIQDTSTNLIVLQESGLGLGDDTRDYYANKNVTSDPILVAYTNMLESFTKILLGSNSRYNRDSIVEVVFFEQKLAMIRPMATTRLDFATGFDKVNISWLQTNFAMLNWSQYFNALFKPVNITLDSSETIALYASPYFNGLYSLLAQYQLTERGIQTLQNYLVFQAVLKYAPYFGGGFEAASNSFKAALEGQRGSRERWQFCLQATNEVLGFPLGAMYVEKYFPSSDKDNAKQIVDQVIASFRTRISQASWIDDATRTKALEKLDFLSYDLGYPDWLLNDAYMDTRYSNFTVLDDFTQNQFLQFTYKKQREFASLRLTPDNLDWEMTPQTSNAYYTAAENKIVIPAANIVSPFYLNAEGLPTALNYGGLGAIIGHEVTHGFDNTGRQFDEYGNLVSWWNDATAQKFNEKTQCWINKFNTYTEGDLHLRGQQTLSENIADSGGLKIAYQAYKKAEKEGRTGGTATKLIGVDLTADQLFFLNWAQSWCAIYTPEALKLQILENEHAPAKFRVLGAATDNTDFANAFSCHPGSRMMSGPQCNLW